MDQKLLLWGGFAAVGLLFLSSSASARSEAKPPALPAPPPRVMPAPPETKKKPTPGAPPKGGKVLELEPITITPSAEAQAEADRLAAVRAAAAAAAAADAAASATFSSPVTSPLSSALSEPTAALPMSVPVAPPPDVKSSRSQPIGYDPAAARRGAISVANNLKRGKATYDRRLLKAWQLKAGLTADGLYGGATRGALIYFGVKDPPQPFAAAATKTIPYTPPA